MDLSNGDFKLATIRRKHLYPNFSANDPNAIAESLESSLEDLEFLKQAFKQGDPQVKAHAACWLSFIGDIEAMKTVTELLERAIEDVDSYFLIRMVSVDHIPPLSRFEPFVKLILENLAPDHSCWETLLQIAGIQKIQSAQPILREILLNEKYIPNVDRLVYWLSAENKDFDTYLAAFKFLSPDVELPEYMRPDLNSFLAVGNRDIRDHYLNYLKGSEEPNEYGWNYNYAFAICSYGEEVDLDEIRQFLQDSTYRFRGEPVAAIARILGDACTDELVGLAASERWGGYAIEELVKLHSFSESAMIIDLIEERLIQGDQSIGIRRLLELALLIGGDRARQLALKYVERIEASQQRSIFWEINQLTLESLIDTLTKYGIEASSTAAAVRQKDLRSYGQKRFDGDMVREVLRPIFASFDSESDELPNHEKPLTVLAEHPFAALGFELTTIAQDSDLLDEEERIQSHKVKFLFDGRNYGFEGQTQGDWYDCGGIVKSLTKAVSESREDWELRLADGQGQDVEFYVAPVALLTELSEKFYIRFYQPEPIDDSLSREERLLNALFGGNQ